MNLPRLYCVCLYGWNQSTLIRPRRLNDDSARYSWCCVFQSWPSYISERYSFEASLCRVINKINCIIGDQIFSRWTATSIILEIRSSVSMNVVAGLAWSSKPLKYNLLLWCNKIEQQINSKQGDNTYSRHCFAINFFTPQCLKVTTQSKGYE